MEIKLFDKNNLKFIKEAAMLLAKTFPQAYNNSSMDEMNNILEVERVAVMAIEKDKLIGFIGAIPQYGNTGWELHPLVVDEQYRGRGVGSALENFLVSQVVHKGGIMMYLGTDDEFNQTSLAYVDLFNDPFEKIKNIINISHHSFEFYLKRGYIITGVIPDANGFGKPDIIMAKRLINT